MQTATKAIISATLAADASLSPTERKTLLAALERGAVNQADPIPRILRRKEVASLLGVSEKRVDQICNAGGLVRVHSPGAKRAMGFSESSVRALVEGRTGKAVA